MNKDRFSTSQEYEEALRNKQYAGLDPIDSKIAGMCLQDGVTVLGDVPETMGSCPFAPECNYKNNKISGTSGFCLKQTVGVVIK